MNSNYRRLVSTNGSSVTHTRDEDIVDEQNLHLYKFFSSLLLLILSTAALGLFVSGAFLYKEPYGKTLFLAGGIAAALVVICLVCTGNEDFKPYEESDSNRTALLNGLRDESLRDSNMSHGKEEMP